jgi:alkylhydroperoxidase/carboxymuconolactone decarboxylase family protein
LLYGWGSDCLLPVVFLFRLTGLIAAWLKISFPMEKSTYYNPADLAKFGNISEWQPEMGRKFFDYYAEVFKDGALTEREKSLIALAVAHAVQCPYCIDAYTTDSLQKGADEAQMMEAVHVAAAIKGGAALVHGVQMMNKAKELSM